VLDEATLTDAERRALAYKGVELWLPLVSANTLQGILLIGPKATDDWYSEEDRKTLMTLAHQSAITAHNARLLSEVEGAREALAKAHRRLLDARDNERRNLAHEMHDGPVQQLLAISYDVARLSKKAGREPVLRGALDGVRRDMLDVVSDLRSYIGQLRPAGLEELGLALALEGDIAALERERDGQTPQIERDLQDDGRGLPPGVALCLFRVAHEALWNALQHANASHVLVGLYLEPDAVQLTVADDGSGFQVPKQLTSFAAQNHFGLVSMKERVNQMGGDLIIKSDEAAGTEVTVRVPIDPKEANDVTDDQGGLG
jgi:signal transduction histidine kinase